MPTSETNAYGRVTAVVGVTVKGGVGITAAFTCFAQNLELRVKFYALETDVYVERAS